MRKHSCHSPYIFCQVSVKRNMTFTIPKIVFFSVFYQEKWEIFRITQDRSHFIINRIPYQQGVNINCKQVSRIAASLKVSPSSTRPPGKETSPG